MQPVVRVMRVMQTDKQQTLIASRSLIRACDHFSQQISKTTVSLHDSMTRMTCMTRGLNSAAPLIHLGLVEVGLAVV